MAKTTTKNKILLDELKRCLKEEESILKRTPPRYKKYVEESINGYKTIINGMEELIRFEDFINSIKEKQKGDKEWQKRQNLTKPDMIQ